MKTFCRALSCILVAVMLLLAFSSCGGDKKTTDAKGNDNPSNSEGTSGDNPAVNVKKPEINERFDGKTVKFCINNQGLNSRSIDLTDGEDGDDPTFEVNAKVLERNEKIKKELGVTVELSKTVAMQAAAEHLVPILSSNVYTYDVIGLYQYFDMGLCLNDTVGSFYNLLGETLKDAGSYLNIDAPYWSRAILDNLTYRDAAFFITGDLNQSYIGSMFVSYVNSKMWNEWKDKIAALPSAGGIGDVYELIEKGYWTLDLWMEISNLVYEDTNKNQKIDMEDRVGYMSYNSQLSNIMTDMLAAGSHVVYSANDEDGVPQMRFNSPHNLAFADKLYQLMCESKAACIPWLKGAAADGKDLYIMDVFAGGNVLMTVNSLYRAETNLAEMEDDFYVLPLPMFDRNQFKTVGYTTQLGDSVNQYAICTAIGDERVPLVTATMELLGYYSLTMVTPAYYDVALKDRYTRDERAAEMIDMTKDGIYTDFALAWSHDIGDVTWFFRTDYANKGTMGRTMKAKQSLYSKSLKKLCTSIEEAYFVEA